MGIIGGVILSLTLFFTPDIAPKVETEWYSLEPPMTIEPQDFMLDNAELFIKDTLSAPESIAIRGNDIFTGDSRGRVYRIRNSEDVTMLAEFGYPCPATMLSTRLDVQENCSYPLAFRFSPVGKLYFTDPYKGILRIDTETGATEVIIDKAEPIEEEYAHVPEDLDITKEGTIYWTDGSTKYPIGNFHTDGFAKPSGRLLKYDPTTKKSTVLLRGIHFLNGVQLSGDETFVLAADTYRRQILRYYMAGEKTGQHDVFVDRLPGYPDNLRPNGKGGFCIALVIPRNENFTLWTESLAQYPTLRRFIVRLRYYLLEFFGQLAMNESQREYMTGLCDYVFHFSPLFDMSELPKVGLVLEVDGNGQPIKLLQSSKNQMEGLSQFTVGSEYAYTSTPLGRNIWRIKLSDL